MRPFAGWIVDAFGRRVPLALALVLLSGAAALLLTPAGWVVLANRVLTGIAFSIGTTAFYTLAVEVGPGRAPQRGAGLRGAGAHARDRASGRRSRWRSTRASARGNPARPNVSPRSPSGAVAIALASGACFLATVSRFVPSDARIPLPCGRRFRREGLMPAFLNFCAQVPYTGFSAFLPLWAIGRGVGNPGLLFIGSQMGAVASRLLAGRLADRHGRPIVLAPAMVGLAATLVGMSAAAGLPTFFVLAVGYGALYGVAFVVLPGLAGEAAPPAARGAAINTFGLGADMAQLLGPWGLGLVGEPGASAARWPRPAWCRWSGPRCTSPTRAGRRGRRRRPSALFVACGRRRIYSRGYPSVPSNAYPGGPE